MKKRRLRLAGVFGLLAISAAATGAENLLGEKRFGDWEERRFDGSTRYTLGDDQDSTYVRAQSDSAASARYLKLPVDLNQTPWLSWRWRLIEPITAGNEKTRNGDDFAARVYVVYASSFWPGSVRSVNYVWSHSEEPDSSWPNPFTDKAVMVPLRRAGEPGQWQFEQRNIRDDFRRFFDRDISTLRGVAIMTDTDNTGRKAIADYADMQFSAEPRSAP